MSSLGARQKIFLMFSKKIMNPILIADFASFQKSNCLSCKSSVIYLKTTRLKLRFNRFYEQRVVELVKLKHFLDNKLHKSFSSSHLYTYYLYDFSMSCFQRRYKSSHIFCNNLFFSIFHKVIIEITTKTRFWEASLISKNLVPNSYNQKRTASVRNSVFFNPGNNHME